MKKSLRLPHRLHKAEENPVTEDPDPTKNDRNTGNRPKIFRKVISMRSQEPQNQGKADKNVFNFHSDSITGNIYKYFQVKKGNKLP